MNYQTVVAGTDGSEASLGAVDRAAELAAAASALLVVVCAYSAIPPRAHAKLRTQLGDTRFDRALGTDAAEDALRTAAARAEGKGARGYTSVLVEGEPVQGLLGVAEKRDADVIVVSNRGIGSLAGRLMGAVAVGVSQRARCDVLIVHAVEGGAL